MNKREESREEKRDTRVILIDNYDSFTYNLYQYISQIVPEVRVFRNDSVSPAEIEEMKPKYIVISPGPKRPKDAGISKQVIRSLGKRIKILGVCLGHQCINEVFGGKTIRAPYVRHGKTSAIQHDGNSIFAGLPQPLEVARYHSLIVDNKNISKDLEISAWTHDNIIMGLRHKHFPIEGLQFHPESFLTPQGMLMMQNFFRE